MIVVDTEAHRMTLCEAGVAVRGLSVKIGGGGVDKRREGDRKTPLGTYPLDSPRESSLFHKFLAIGYPTAAQRAEGRTGGGVGIHGPSRRYAWLKGWVDWTDGCIAVESDNAIDEVAAWASTNHVRRVVIR